MHDNKTPPEIDLNNLIATAVLGKGATGTVFLVNHNSQSQPFALKVVQKSSTATNRRARHEIAVLRRLSASHHPFLPNLIASSETPELICWATPFCPGGDLNVLRHLQNDAVFSPAAIRFYIAEIICALEHLHEQGIVYRDLKPENILLQDSGHVTLTDFDLSRDLVPRKPNVDQIESPVTNSIASNSTSSIKIQQQLYASFNQCRKFSHFITSKKSKNVRVSPITRKIPNTNDFSTNERSNSFVGTEEYVAPEIIRGDGHEFAVDWWTLGILCYEMMYGTTPFKGKNRKETYRNILFAEPEFNGKPNALTDLIRKLLEKDPTRRLGYQRGACEIKEHGFFSGLRWDLVTEVLRPPFLPLREETEVVEGGIDIREYFEKLNLPPSSDECGDNVSLTEF